MTNHPNRSWRRRMHDACERFLARCSPPAGAVAALMTVDDVRQIQAQAYTAGYADGRESTRRKPDDAPAV